MPEPVSTPEVPEVVRRLVEEGPISISPPRSSAAVIAKGSPHCQHRHAMGVKRLSFA